MNTLLSGASGALTSFYLKPYFMKKISPISNLNPLSLSNGLLAGLVSVTSVCNNVEPYNAVVIGFLGGLVYVLSCWILARLRIDDPTEASEIHGFCGLFGCLCVGFFDNDKGLIFTGSFKQLGI